MPLLLDEFGLQVKTEAESLQDMIEDARSKATLGQAFKTAQGSAGGDTLNVFNSQLALVHLALLGLFQSFNVQAAEGVQLDNLASIIGVIRFPASQSTAAGVVAGDQGTVVPAASTTRIPNGTRWDTALVVTIPFGKLVTITTFIAGETYTVTLDATPFVYLSLVTDTAADVLLALALLVDADATFEAHRTGDQSGLRVRRTDLANPVISVSATGGAALAEIAQGWDLVNLVAEQTGPNSADAGGISEIVDAVAGWAVVDNLTPATLGRIQETDAQLRLRMKVSLQAGGKATELAIRAALEKVPNVLKVIVTSNRTLVTDSEGLPPKSFRAVVHPATVDAATVALTIWENQPAGIESFGTESALITDDQGFFQTVFWSFSADVDLFVEVDVTTTTLFPTSGEDLVRDAVEAYGETLSVNDPFLPLALECLVLDITGVTDVDVRVGLSAFPTQTTPFPVATDERVILDKTAPRTVVAIT